jgi:hypothetical protein
LGVPLIPNWNRVLAAIPDYFDRLLDAVDSDVPPRLDSLPLAEERYA